MATAQQNPLQGITIAIDGPAGAGKGTLGIRLARHFRMKYLDTGTLYRAVAYLAQQNDINLNHPDKLAAMAREMNFDFKHIGNDLFHTFINGTDVNAHLRTPGISEGASVVAALPDVRFALKSFQIAFAKEWAAKIGVIMDGRDIGTVICPQAEIKFFLDADAEIRAKRRHLELMAKGIERSYESILEDVKQRDKRDRTRSDAPLRPAEDAVLIDSSTLDADSVFNMATNVLHQKLKHKIRVA